MHHQGNRFEANVTCQKLHVGSIPRCVRLIPAHQSPVLFTQYIHGVVHGLLVLGPSASLLFEISMLGEAGGQCCKDGAGCN